MFSPRVSSYDLFRHTAIWLTILLSKIAAERRLLVVPLFACFVLFSKILIVSTSLSVAEVAGAVVALLIWIALYPAGRIYLATVVSLFGAMVIAQRLEPFQFASYPIPFGWVPFRSFMYGSINIDVLSFLEKFFQYGAVIWLLVEIGMSRRSATGIVVSTLFATSLAETYLPHRSAEITDALMALTIGGIFALISQHDRTMHRRTRTTQSPLTPAESKRTRERLSREH